MTASGASRETIAPDGSVREFVNLPLTFQLKRVIFRADPERWYAPFTHTP